jgi:hypothetical protein
MMLGGSNIDGGWGNCFICQNSLMGGAYNNINNQGNSNILGGQYLAVYGTMQTCANIVYKTSGSFTIPHPDPAKNKTHQLRHSFVESPNEGDTLYRYVVCAVDCNATLELPSYFKFLNKNIQVKIAPKNHFGRGYGIVDESLTCVDITTNCDGQYNVLVMGTRKDKMAVCAWKGVEPTKEIHGLGFDWEI